MAGVWGLVETASCPVSTSVGAGPEHRRAKRHHACPGPLKNPNHHKLKGIRVTYFSPLRTQNRRFRCKIDGFVCVVGQNR